MLIVIPLAPPSVVFTTKPASPTPNHTAGETASTSSISRDKESIIEKLHVAPASVDLTIVPPSPNAATMPAGVAATGLTDTTVL